MRKRVAGFNPSEQIELRLFSLWNYTGVCSYAPVFPFKSNPHLKERREP